MPVLSRSVRSRSARYCLAFFEDRRSLSSSSEKPAFITPPSSRVPGDSTMAWEIKSTTSGQGFSSFLSQLIGASAFCISGTTSRLRRRAISSRGRAMPLFMRLIRRSMSATSPSRDMTWLRGRVFSANQAMASCLLFSSFTSSRGCPSQRLSSLPPIAVRVRSMMESSEPAAVPERLLWKSSRFLWVWTSSAIKFSVE